MNILPTNNIRFGAYFYNSYYNYNDAQKEVLDDIESTLKSTAPFDKNGRSYNDYLDSVGYDILVNPANNNGIRVNVLRQPISEADKVRRKYGEFRYSDEGTQAGIYDNEHSFDINDVMNIYNADNKSVNRSKTFLLLSPLIYIAVASLALFGISKIPASNKSTPEVIEKTLHDSTAIAKDTINMFK